jgi:hypothetical protein
LCLPLLQQLRRRAGLSLPAHDAPLRLLWLLRGELCIWRCAAAAVLLLAIAGGVRNQQAAAYADRRPLRLRPHAAAAGRDSWAVHAATRLAAASRCLHACCCHRNQVGG